MKEGMRIDAAVVGGSAGGQEAVAQILARLPAGGATFPIVVVLHRSNDPAADYGSILGYLARGQLVKEAEPLERLAPGTIYVAPAGYHLLIEPERTFALSIDERVKWSRPSIDVLFESGADAFGEGLVGIVLSGANDDGAAGLRAVAARGGLAVVQDPKTARFAVMPSEALATTPAARILTLSEIGDLLAAARPAKPGSDHG